MRSSSVSRTRVHTARRSTRRTFGAALVTTVVLITASMTAQVMAQTRPDAAPDPVSQATPAGPLTLEQVLELAEGRSETVGVARQGVRRASADQIRARSGLFPQLSLAASYDRTLATEFDGLFNDTTFSNTGTTTPDDTGNGAANEGGLENLPFGRLNTWRVSLAFSQNLFSGGRIGAQRALAAAGGDAAALTLTSTRAQLLFDVTQAYYDAALTDRLVTIAEATIAQATSTLQQTEAAFRAGTQPEFDVLRARVTRDTQNPTLIRTRINRELAFLRLKQALDLPPSYDLRLADTLLDESLPPAPVFASRLVVIEATLQPAALVQTVVESATPIADRTAVQSVATTVRLREATLASVKAQRMPSVTLNSSYGRNAYPSNVLAPRFDRTNWTVGVGLSLPLLTGGRQRGDELVAAAELEQSRLQLRQTEELAGLDTRSAWAELLASRATWESTAGTVKQAGRAYEIADVRYRAGVSTQLELSDSRLLLQQAEATRAQAARDLQVARARVALLPDLPLGNGASTTQQQTPAAPATQSPQTPQQGTGTGQIRSASTQGTTTQFGGR